MWSVLEELYYGKICPNRRRYIEDEEYQGAMKLIKKINENREMLIVTEKRNQFIDYEDAWNAVVDISNRETFIYGFDLGLRMGMELAERQEENPFTD